MFYPQRGMRRISTRGFIVFTYDLITVKNEQLPPPPPSDTFCRLNQGGELVRFFKNKGFYNVLKMPLSEKCKHLLLIRGGGVSRRGEVSAFLTVCKVFGKEIYMTLYGIPQREMPSISNEVSNVLNNPLFWLGSVL